MILLEIWTRAALGLFTVREDRPPLHHLSWDHFTWGSEDAGSYGGRPPQNFGCAVLASILQHGAVGGMNVPPPMRPLTRRLGCDLDGMKSIVELFSQQH